MILCNNNINEGKSLNVLDYLKNITFLNLENNSITDFEPFDA